MISIAIFSINYVGRYFIVLKASNIDTTNSRIVLTEKCPDIVIAYITLTSE